MKLSCRMVFGLVCLLAMPMAAHAQNAPISDDTRPGVMSVGGYVGVEFDDANHPLTLGVDGRLRVKEASYEINPRLWFRPFDGGSTKQLDVNVLHNFALANPGRIRPYIGAGLGVSRLSLDRGSSDTELGVNLVSGARLSMRPGAAYEPFLNVQYTILNDRINSFTIVVGSSFSLR